MDPTQLGSRRIGRLANRLPSVQSQLSQLPVDAQVLIFDFLVDELDQVDDERRDLLAPEPICDGEGVKPDGTACLVDEYDAEMQRFFHSQEINPVLANVLRVPLSTNAVGVDFLNLVGGEVVSSVETRITEMVERQLHELHAVGFEPPRRWAFAKARQVFTKFLVTLMILHTVPLVEAAPGPSVVRSFVSFCATVAGLWTWLYSNYQSLSHAAGAWIFEMWGMLVVLQARLGDAVSTHFDETYGACVHAMRSYYEYHYEKIPVASGTVGECARYASWYRCLYGWLLDLFSGQNSLRANVLSQYSDQFYEQVSSDAYDRYVGFWVASLLLSVLAVYLLRFVYFTLKAIIVPRVRAVVEWYRTRASYWSTMTYLPGGGRRVALGSLVDKLGNIGRFKEMALPGSPVDECSYRSGMVAIVSFAGHTCTFVGMGFRYGDLLITARHNLDAEIAGSTERYAIPFVKDGEKGRLGHVSEKFLIPSVDQDIIPERASDLLDVSAIPVDANVWSRAKVGSLKLGNAGWNSSVHTFGCAARGNRRLLSAQGHVCEEKEGRVYALSYTASTSKGWSGSPVLLRGKVVAVHVSTSGSVNIGTNMVIVDKLISLTRLETGVDAIESDSNYSEDWTVTKVEGIVRGRSGRRARVDNIDIFDERYEAPRALTVLQDVTTGRIEFSTRSFIDRINRPDSWAMDVDDDSPLERTSVVLKPTPEESEDSDSDESLPDAVPPSATSSEVTKPPSPSSKARFDFQSSTYFQFSDENGKQLKAPTAKKSDDRVVKLVDKEEARKLGYTPGEFVLPDMFSSKTSARTSTVALSNYLGKAETAFRQMNPPDEELLTGAMCVVGDMLKKLRYQVSKEPVTTASLVSLINSTAVDGSRSPGLPFVADGYTTNASVIAEYTVEGLANLVFDQYQKGTWDHPTVNFGKFEPTKASKVSEGYTRCIQAAGLASQLIGKCFFQGLTSAMVENYRESPIAGGWSPNKVGDAKFFAERFAEKKKTKYFAFDGKFFDYTSHPEWIYDAVTSIMINLALPSPGMTSEEFQRWKLDARSVMDTFATLPIQLPDGRRIEKNMRCVLASGRFDTFIRNSITVLLWDTLVKLKMGFSPQQLHKDFVVTVGGDDNLQRVPVAFSPDKYQDVAATFGFHIHKIVESPTFNGLEFYSTRFEVKFGMVTWTPTRFTKHVESLLMTKFEDLAGALCSHMMNWVHDEVKFHWFRDLYLRGRSAAPDLFDLAKLPDRGSLIRHLSGLESFSVECIALVAKSRG